MAIQSYGAELWIGDSDPVSETFYKLAGMGDVDGPSMSLEDEETLAHDSGTAFITKEPTFIDPGELSFEIFLNPQHVTHRDSAPPGLAYYFLNRTVFNMIFAAPDPSQTSRAFAGYVKNFGEAYPVKGHIKRSVTIAFSSPPTAAVYPGT